MIGEAMSGDIAFEDFARVDMRVGRIIDVDPFPEARKPAWKLTIRPRRTGSAAPSPT